MERVTKMGETIREESLRRDRQHNNNNNNKEEERRREKVRKKTASASGRIVGPTSPD